MQFRLLGPTGVQRRIAEIEERIGAPVQNPDGATEEFTPALVGEIGSGERSFRPINPLSGNFSIEGDAAGNRFGPMVRQAAEQAGIDPYLFDALVASESSYDPGARSRAGAMGLAQLMPGTAASLGVSNPFDPAQSLRGGATYLSQMLKRFDGDPRLALAAYNAGPGAVEKYGGVPPYRETQAYVNKILSLAEARRPKP